MLHAWERILEPIPDSELERAYVAAMQKHEGFGLIGPGAIVRAYRDYSQGGGMEPAGSSHGISYSHQQYLERIAKISRRGYQYQFSHPDRFYERITQPSPPEWRGAGHVDELSPSLGGPIHDGERAAVIHAIRCGATGDDIRTRREADFAGRRPIRQIGFEADWNK